MSQKLVLLCLADQANDAGVCWPSYQSIEQRTGLCERTIRTCFQDLERRGYVARNYRPGHSTSYQLPVAYPLQTMPPANAAPLQTLPLPPAKYAPPGPCKPFRDRPLQTMPPESSVESSVESSKKRQARTRAKTARGSRLPTDWTPNPNTVQWAQAFCRGVDLDQAVAEFHDYWEAVPGSKALKLDWEGTFRNRLRAKYLTAKVKR